MFSDKIIRNVLRRYIDRGIKNFAIYPFGVNGQIVKNCLEQCFDILPVAIIDNEYSKYSSRICNIEEYRKCISDSSYVVLTVEDRKCNANMFSELLDFLPENRIINLIEENLSEKEKNLVSRKNTGFCLKNILPCKNAGGGRKNRIKIRFVHVSHLMWNSIITLYMQFKNDPRFDVLFICADRGSERNAKIQDQMMREMCNYVMETQYDAAYDKPDILIISGMGGILKGEPLIGIRKYVRLIIAVPAVVQRYTFSIEENWKLHLELKVYQPDYYLLDSLLYNELKKSSVYTRNMIEMGNPKYDEIFRACQKKVYSKEWGKKLRGKKTVLWTTTHGKWIDMNEDITDHVSFDLYAKPFFTYAEKHLDMGFVFRPHPSLITELLMYGYWSKNDLLEMKRYCEETSNVVWDESDTYEAAYSVSDAVITDVLCGIVVSALPTLKPICVLYRDDKEIVPLHQDVVENYYSVHSERELIDFLDMVQRGEDPMLEQRKELSKRCVMHFDGKNGERMKKFIMEKYHELVQ